MKKSMLHHELLRHYGFYVKCNSELMYEMIREWAMAHGIPASAGGWSPAEHACITWDTHKILPGKLENMKRWGRDEKTVEEFIGTFFVEPIEERLDSIDGYDVKICKNGLIVGCKTLSFDRVAQVASAVATYREKYKL